MNIKFTKTATVLVTLLLCFNWLKAQTLDQSQTQIQGGVLIPLGYNYDYGQSFTCGIAGKLSSVELSLHSIGTINSPTFSVKIFKLGANGFPTGAAIATSNPATFTTAGFTAFTFPATPCVNLIAGVKYAIVEYSDENNLIWDIQSSPDVYLGGNSFSYYNTTQTWANNLSSADYAFKVYMTDLVAPLAAFNQNLCAGVHTISELVATPLNGATLNWYSSDTISTALASTATVVSGNYYVSQTKNCIEGTRLQIAVTQTSPLAPIVSTNQIYKKYSTYADLDAVGTNLKWSNASTGGSIIPLTNNVADNSIAYVSQTAGTCESSRIAVYLKEISDTVQNVCTSGTVANLITTPSLSYTAQWYASATATAALSPTTALTNGNLFVEQNSNSYAATLIANVGTNVSWTRKLNDSTLVFFNPSSGQLKKIRPDGTGLTTLKTGLSTLIGLDVASNGNIYYILPKQLIEFDPIAVTTNTVYDVINDASLPNYPNPGPETFQAGTLKYNNYDGHLRWIRNNQSDKSIMDFNMSNLQTNAYLFANVTAKGLDYIPELSAYVYISSTGELKNYPGNIVLGGVSSGLKDIEYRNGKLYYTQMNGFGALKVFDAATLTSTSVPTTLYNANIEYADIDVMNDGSVYLSSTYEQNIRKLNATISNRIPVKIKVNNPAPPTPGNLSACFGATIADLTATGEPGAIIKWYLSNTGGAALTGTTVLATGTTYYASQTVYGCESSTRAAATPTVLAPTPAPYRYKVNVSLTNTSFGTPTDCFFSNGQHVEDGFENGKRRFVLTGTNWAQGNTPFTSYVKYNGTNWVITYNGTTSYSTSATSTNNFPPTTGWTSGCSQVAFTSLTIDSLNNNVCYGNTLETITGIGQNITWYSAATGGTVIPNATVMQNNTHYYASQTINGCEGSARLDFVPQSINATYSITSSQGVSVCGPITSQNFTVTSTSSGTGTVNWFSTPNITTYDVAFGLSPIATGTAASVTGVNSTTTIYSTAYDGTCYSYPRVPVTVSVNVTPAIGNVSVDMIVTGSCGSTSTFVFDSIINGKNRYVLVPNPYGTSLKFDGTKWIIGNATTQLAECTTVPAGLLPPATGWNLTYSACPGNTLVLSNFINLSVPSTFCTGATLANVVVANAQNVKWYSTSTSSVVLSGTTTLVSGAHYYGTQTMNGCESQTRYDLVPTIVSPPTASIVASATTACTGNAITLNANTGTGYTYVWKKNGVLINGVTTSSYSANASGSYVVEVSANGCSTISSPVSLTIGSPVAPTGASYEPLVLYGFNQDIVANGTDYTNSTTTSVDANTDNCRFIDSTYTQFGTPTRYLPGGGAFYSQEPTTPNLPFKFASYTSNNALTLQTGSMSGTLTLASAKKMDAFYLLATGGGGSSAVNYTITFSDASTQTSSLTITDWFNGSNAAIKGTGRYYNNALGFQAPTDNNPRIYQFLINIGVANQNKLVQSVSFTRTNAGVMKAQIMGITAVTPQKFCTANNPTVADLTATGTAIQWYSSLTGGTAIAPSTALVNNNTYYPTQNVNGCISNRGDAVIVKVNATPTRTVNKTSCASYTWPINNQTYSTTGTYTNIVTATIGCDSIISLNLTINSLPTIAVNNGTICSGSSFTLNATGATTYTYSSGSNIVSPSTNSSYTVTGVDVNGCANTAVSNVHVNALPNVGVNSGSICNGQSFTLNATGATSYVYSSNSNIVTPTSNNQYTVTGTDANGCNGMAVSMVTVNALPTISAPSTTICNGSSVVLNASGATTYTWSTGANSSSISVGPTTNTSYTVAGTSAEGCVGSDVVVDVTIGAAPSVAVNSSTICAGSSATLIATGLTTYTWSTGSNATSIVVTPTVNTTYSVSGNLVGCSVGANNVGNVTVNQLPTITASTNNTLLCAGNTVTLTANGASAYVWNTNDNTASIVVNPTTTTVYTVIGTDANGCENTTTVQQDVSVCTGVENVASDTSASIIVYPNPTSGVFYIEVVTDTKIELVDVLGKTIIKQQITAGKYDLNITNQAEGIYFIKATANGATKTVRVVKQ